MSDNDPETCSGLKGDCGSSSDRSGELPVWHLGGGKIVRGPDGEGPRVKTPEDHLFAALLSMVLDHCVRPEGILDSFDRAANREAMQLLAEASFIRIDGQDGERIWVTVTPEAETFLAWMGTP